MSIPQKKHFISPYFLVIVSELKSLLLEAFLLVQEISHNDK